MVNCSSFVQTKDLAGDLTCLFHDYVYISTNTLCTVGWLLLICKLLGNSSTKTSPAPGYVLSNDEKAEVTKVLEFYVQGSFMLCSHSGKTIPEYLWVWMVLRYICNTHCTTETPEQTVWVWKAFTVWQHSLWIISVKMIYLTILEWAFSFSE